METAFYRFQSAMMLLERGLHVARDKWQKMNGPRLLLAGPTGKIARGNGLEYLDPVPYVFDREDLTATDWYVVCMEAPTTTTAAPTTAPR